MSFESALHIKSLAVVVPVFNESETLSYSHHRLSTALKELPVTSVELIYVNDGSTDSSDAILKELLERHSAEACREEPNITLTYIELSRNFGHSAAVLAGLEAADADAVAIIDADLQDPPELIKPMLEEVLKGNDVVFGRRQARESEPWFKRVSAWAFYRVLRLFAGFEIPADTGDFRVMTRQVRDAVLDCRETEPFLRGLVAWVGFRQKPFDYIREGRRLGKTKYPLRKMTRFATLAILSFSVKPLRIAAYMGAVGFLMCALVALFAVISWAEGKTLRGWTSLVLAFMSVQSLTLMIIGILGAYVGRIYSEVQRRPRHLTRRRATTRVDSPHKSRSSTR